MISSFVRGGLVLLAVLALAGPALAQGTSESGGAGSAVMIGSDSLHGTKVYDTDGKQLGTISRLLIGADGKVSSVVVKHGGTAGLGGKELAVPWDALKLQRGEKDGVIATMQRDMLEKAPQAERSTSEKQPAASPSTERRR